jgi:hypothetical protein
MFCINQTDDEEKSQQVRQMGDVFKLARHTIVYLGDATAESNFFLNNVKLKSIFNKQNTPTLTNDDAASKFTFNEHNKSTLTNESHIGRAF